jgi:hypothetical protein
VEVGEAEIHPASHAGNRSKASKMVIFFFF